jgi:hypothetical protein
LRSGIPALLSLLAVGLTLLALFVLLSLLALLILLAAGLALLVALLLLLLALLILIALLLALLSLLAGLLIPLRLVLLIHDDPQSPAREVFVPRTAMPENSLLRRSPPAQSPAESGKRTQVQRPYLRRL